MEPTTEPNTEPNEINTEPNEPSTAPNEPNTEPTEPNEPNTEPNEPNTEPNEPNTEPNSEPNMEASAPSPSPVVLAAIQKASQSADPAADFGDILSHIHELSTPDTLGTDLGAVVEAVLEQSLGVVNTRSLLVCFISVLQSVKDREVWITGGTHALQVLAGQHASLSDQAGTIRELVATAHEDFEDFRSAAQVLSEIPLDGLQRKMSEEERARVWVRIARNYLEEDDPTAAEPYVNKLKNVMHAVRDQTLSLKFKLCHARVQDARREFLSASARYHDISVTSVLAEEERLHTLAMAVKCAVLAPAGPQRSRQLGKLFRDERSVELDEFPMLEKMFLERLLTADEVAKFAMRLQPHQLAKTANGFTVLDNAVIEHNLRAVSRLYENISFSALAHRLGLDEARAEDTASQMIEQGRLAGRIDQIEGRLIFDRIKESGSTGGGDGAPDGRTVLQWDERIMEICDDLETIADSLQRGAAGVHCVG